MPQDERELLAEINAAILLTRALVRSSTAGNPAAYTEIVDRARYCQLLATRLKLPLATAHRVDLGAWVSGLEGQDEAKRRLIQQHQLEAMLKPTDAGGTTSCVEAQILGLVTFYQDIKRHEPALQGSLPAILERLNKHWSESAEQRKMTHCLVGILKDEEFLLRAHPVAGKILLVDPEESVSPVVAPLLMAEGYDVRVAHDVPAAREIVSRNPPHVILCQLELPLVNGIEFCRQIKGSRRTAGITFVLTTDRKNKTTIRNCLREGAEDVLTKPIDMEMLCLRLKRFIPQPESRGAVADVPLDGGVKGSLSDMSFTDLIQMVTSSAKTMTLVVSNGDKTGEAVVVNGEVIHAKVGDEEGEGAFYQMMRWTDGDFITRRSADASKRSIHLSAMALLMEGARLSDEDMAKQGG